MSIKELHNVLEHSEHKGSNLLIMIALANLADEQGVCWPSYNYLARITRMSKRTMGRNITNIAGGEFVFLPKAAYAYGRAAPGSQSHLYIMLLSRENSYKDSMRELCTPYIGGEKQLPKVNGGVDILSTPNEKGVDILSLLLSYGSDISHAGEDILQAGVATSETKRVADPLIKQIKQTHNNKDMSTQPKTLCPEFLEIKESLIPEYGATTFETYIEPISSAKIEDGVLIMGVPNAGIRQFLDEQIGKFMRASDKVSEFRFLVG